MLQYLHKERRENLKPKWGKTETKWTDCGMVAEAESESDPWWNIWLEKQKPSFQVSLYLGLEKWVSSGKIEFELK